MMTVHDPGRILHHGQARTGIVLDGIAGDTLDLQGSGELHYEWQTPEKDILDLEIRAQIVSTDAAATAAPIVRYRVEFGQGAVAYQHPQASPNTDVATYGNLVRAIVPARGLVLRTSARQFRIYFAGGTDRNGNPVTSCKVKVSVQPAISQLESLPMQELSRGLAGPVISVMPFPMSAREFRVRDIGGSPFIPGACGIGVVDLFFNFVTGGDVASIGYTEWTPIPPLALGYSTEIDATVEYR